MILPDGRVSRRGAAVNRDGAVTQDLGAGARVIAVEGLGHAVDVPHQGERLA